MAQDTDSLALIRKRKAEIEAQAAQEQAERDRLDEAAAARAKEEEELAIAERVLARLAGANATTPAATEPVKSTTGKKRYWSSSARPVGIPSVPEMVNTLLLDAEKAGKAGLKSREIVDGIADRWWPGVSANMIMPTVYKSISKNHWFVKEGDLIKRLRGGQPPKRLKSDQLRLDS